MNLRRLALAGAAIVFCSSLAAYAAGIFPGFTIAGSTYTMTGNENFPADTGLTQGQTPETALFPGGLVMAGPGGPNALVGADFGMALWQRGTTPINAAQLPGGNNVVYGPDGWYAFINNAGASETLTVSKQTGSTDTFSTSFNGVFASTTASARIQRPNAQTALTQIQFGQLVPDDNSTRFFGNTAIFSCYLLAGGNFSPTGNLVSMVIAYHSAADSATEAANGQGTNSGTFASSAGATQNITNYTEAVNTTVAPTTTWARFSVAATIPVTIGTTTTLTTGVGVKLQWTPVGTAGANDWLEVANCQLEARYGTSTGPSPFQRRNLIEEWNLEYARFYQILENGSGTSIYGVGQAGATNTFNVAFNLPSAMRITPVVSPITAGGFKVNAAGTLQAVSQLSTTGLTQNQRVGSLGGVATITAGQGTTFVGSGAGTGVLGFSAEP